MIIIFSDTIPGWLDALLIGSCSINLFSISRPIIEAILDLIHITQSVIPSPYRKRPSLIGSKSFDAYTSQLNDRTVHSDSVATIPLMSVNHLCFLRKSTNFFKVCSNVF